MTIPKGKGKFRITVTRADIPAHGHHELDVIVGSWIAALTQAAAHPGDFKYVRTEDEEELTGTCPRCGLAVGRNSEGKLFRHQRYAPGSGYGPDQPHELIWCNPPQEPIILHMPRRTPALYWWALRMRILNRINRNKASREGLIPREIDPDR